MTPSFALLKWTVCLHYIIAVCVHIALYILIIRDHKESWDSTDYG